MTNRTGASGGMLEHSDKRLKMARILVGGFRRDFSPDELRIARHMAQDGASFEEIYKALGWEAHITLSAFGVKLKKFNIRSRRSSQGIRAHFGRFPKCKSDVGMEVYRPRTIGAE